MASVDDLWDLAQAGAYRRAVMLTDSSGCTHCVPYVLSLDRKAASLPAPTGACCEAPTALELVA